MGKFISEYLTFKTKSSNKTTNIVEDIALFSLMLISKKGKSIIDKAKNINIAFIKHASMFNLLDNQFILHHDFLAIHI